MMAHVAECHAKQGSVSKGTEGGVAANGSKEGGEDVILSHHHPNSQDSSAHNDVRARAIKLAAEPVVASRYDAWGELTAVSETARKRVQGLHITLHNMEHLLGRNVKDLSCQFDSPSISARHCKISRRIVEAEGSIKITQNNVLGPGERFLVFIKDSSSNGTYLNHQRLRKDSPEACLQHGDIISLVAAPEHENAYAFVYREVFGCKLSASQACLKRKGSLTDDIIEEGSLVDIKRMRGRGIGGSDGPVSLDDVRRLQRANEELRQQLEEHLLTIDKMRNEFRAAEVRHDTELKELRASVSTMFTKQLEDIRLELTQKNKELESYTATTVRQQSMMEDLNQHIVAAAKSRMEAEEAIQNHKASIVELKKRLEDERTQTSIELEACEADFRASLERARQETAEEMKRHVEAAARQQKQHLEVISALQEADKEHRCIADNLRVKLEEEREARMDAEKRVRKLEMQLCEERASSTSLNERVTQLELELQKAFRQLEGEKEARESATAKIVTLELEMETAIRNLKLEKQRLEGARERIVLRETQLRAFHSTAEDIAALQQKQQDQSKTMLRTLEDGDSENHRNTSCMRIGDSGKINSNGRKILPSESENSANRRSFQRADGEIVKGMASDEVIEKVGNVMTSVGSLNRIFYKTTHSMNEMKIKEEESEQGDYVAAPTLSHLEISSARFSTKVLVEDERPADLVTNAAEAVTTQLLEVEYGVFANDVQISTAENRFSLDESKNHGYVKDEETKVLVKGAALDEGGIIFGETMQLDVGEEEDQPDWEKTQAVVEDYGETLLMDTQEDKAPVTDDFHHDGGIDMIVKTSSHDSFKEIQKGTASEKSLFSKLSNSLKGCQNPETASINRRDVHSLCSVDLLASEVAGSWAASTPMSQHDDNDSCDRDERIFQNGQGTTDGFTMEFTTSQVATSDSQRARPQLLESPARSQAAEAIANTLGSQSSPSPRLCSEKFQRNALSEMISIVAPEFEGLNELMKSDPHASDSEDSSDKEGNDKNASDSEDSSDKEGNDKDEGDNDSTGSEHTSKTPSVSTSYKKLWSENLGC